MFVAWWRHVVRRWRKGPALRSRRAGARQSFTRFWVEPLEDRIVPSTFRWNVDASGSWTNAANWALVSGAGSYPNAIDDVAEFDSVITATRTVTIPTGTTITVGSIQIDSSQNYIIAGADATAVLNFQVSSGNATLAVTDPNGDGSHTLSGAITLASNLTVSNGSNGPLTISGAIQGGQALTYTGTAAANTLVLSGPNTYTGSTTINGGTLSISSDSNLGTAPGSATPADLVLDGGTLKATTGFTLNSNRGIALGPSSGSGTGTVDVSGSSNTLTYDGILTDNGSGSGALTKTDSGTLLLDVDSADTYTGATTINGGALDLNGSLTSAVAVNNGGTLVGDGSTNGTVTVNTGGTINPGTVGTVGTLSVGGLTFNGGTYQADINGNFSDLIRSSGPINLDGGTRGTFTLNSVGGVTSPAKVFTLIDNTSGSAIGNPSFNGAVEGGSTTVNGETAYYSNDGGNGQDFTLTVSGAPDIRSDGTLSLERLVSGSVNNLQVLQGGTVIASVPTQSVTGTITIHGDAANTTLTIDYTAGGYFQNDVDFAGFGATNTLVVKGNANGGFGNITYTYTGAHSGTIQNYSDAAGTILLNTITYSGLAPLTNTGTATAIVFNLPAGVTDAHLANFSPGNEKLSSAGNAFESTTFADPTGSLTLNGTGAVADDLTVTSLTSPFAANLTLDLSSSPSSEIDFTGANTLTSGNSITATATTITDVGAALTTSGGGSITLNAGSSLAVAASLNAGSGGVSLSTTSGSISQTAVITGGLLTTSSASGTNLSTVTNAVTSFNATNSGAGVVKLLDAVTTLTVTGISDITAGGSVSVSNSGSLSLATGAVNGGGNPITLTASGSSAAISEGIGGTISTSATLTTNSTGGTSLGNANTISTFHAADNSSVGVSLTNTATPLAITGISASGGGGIAVTNTGPLTTTGSVTTAANGNITLAATGTETIGATLTAGGNGAVTLTNGGQLMLNVDVTGDGGFTQNGAGNVATSGTRTITTVGGPITFSSALTLGGNLTVTAGTGAISLNSAATPALTLNANTLTVINTAASLGVIAGQITGSGGITKQGTGTLTLTALGSSYSGASLVNGGTFQVNGSITGGVTLNQLPGTPAFLAGSGTVGSITAGSAGGTLAPGSVGAFGTLTSTGSVTLNANTTYLLQLNGHATAGAPVVGTDYSHLHADSSVSLNGAALQLAFGATPSRLQDIFSLVNLPVATGSRFGSITVTGVPGASVPTGADGTVVTVGGQQYQLTYSGGAGVLSRTSTDINFTHIDVVRNGTGVAIPNVAQVGGAIPTTQALATFNDDMGKPAGHFLALINWGDPTSGNANVTVGTVASQGSTYAVYGTHTYHTPGPFAISIKLVIDGNFDGNRDQSLAPAPLVPRFSTITIQDAVLVGNSNQAAAAAVVSFFTGQEIDPASLNRFQSLATSNPNLLHQLFLQSGVQLIYSGVSSIQGQVTEVWHQFYHRNPTPTELATWTHYLAQVGNREGLSIIVASSLSYFQQAGSSNAQWLVNLYRDYFNSPIDPGTLAFWLGQLNSRRMSRATVAKDLISGYAGDALQIQFLYNRLLGRNATAAEIAGWEANRPHTTLEQIALALVLSPEFAARLAQLTSAFTRGATSFYEPGQAPAFTVANLGFPTLTLITKGTFY